MLNKRIFIIDDEPDMLKVTSDILQQEGFMVSSETSASAGLKRILSNPPDIVVLDNRMPEMNGYEVCRELRNDQRTRHLPIIIVSVKNDETDVVVGLQVGADDYVSKPVRRHELIARIGNILRRRASEPENDQVQVGPLTLDYSKFNVMVNHDAVDLTPKEFELLRYFLSRQGRVLTRENISEHVWGTQYIGTTRTIDVHVDQLRKKLGKWGGMIKTLKGIGYQLDAGVMHASIPVSKGVSHRKASRHQ